MINSQIVVINPLVLFSIADHYKRKKAEFGLRSFRIIGCLYGVQQSHSVKITLSTPIKINSKQPTTVVNKDVVYQTFKAYDQLIKFDHVGNHLNNLVFLGWYSVRENLTPYPQDQSIFQYFGRKSQNLIYLLMTPIKSEKQLKVFKKIRVNQTTSNMVEIPYDYAVQKSQTICIQSINSQAKESPYLKTLNSSKSVLMSYNEKLDELRKLLPLIQNDKIKMRRLNTILNSLKYVSQQKDILTKLDYSVVQCLSTALYIEKNHMQNSSEYD